MYRALLAGVVIASACGPKSVDRTYPAPAVADVTTKLGTARSSLTSFRGASTMDYWLSGQRAKGDVLVMGALGRKVRFAALSPAGGSTLAEMACDGTNFVYVDYQKNCQMTGPCDAKSVAMFFGLELEPDDFVHLALGTPPVLDGATGTVTWDGKRGLEKVTLTAGTSTQKLTVDARENRWDVVETELAENGKVRWSVANTDFTKRDGSGERRVPGKTRFKSPAQSQDLLVEWNEMEVNVEIPDEKFKLEAPAGLPRC